MVMVRMLILLVLVLTFNREIPFLVNGKSLLLMNLKALDMEVYVINIQLF